VFFSPLKSIEPTDSGLLFGRILDHHQGSTTTRSIHASNGCRIDRIPVDQPVDWLLVGGLEHDWIIYGHMVTIVVNSDMNSDFHRV